MKTHITVDRLKGSFDIFIDNFHNWKAACKNVNKGLKFLKSCFKPTVDIVTEKLTFNNNNNNNNNNNMIWYDIWYDMIWYDIIYNNNNIIIIIVIHMVYRLKILDLPLIALWVCFLMKVLHIFCSIYKLWCHKNRKRCQIFASDYFES